MHRVHAIGLALLCCSAALALAACGSGQQVQVNYASLANDVCRTLTTANKPASVTLAQRVQHAETALAGLQALNPPASVQTIYNELVGNYKVAVDSLKANEQKLTQLTQQLNGHPNDAQAQKQYNAITSKIQGHLSTAADNAFTLGILNCQKAFTS